jgi:catechol 2,3-dioxygenase-like lactoylglutathione lyase family enzyme
VPLNHVALTVHDRNRSEAFHHQHFGLTERVHEDAHLLILGSPDGSLVALSEGPMPDGLPRTNHFGFQLEDRDDDIVTMFLERAQNHLRAISKNSTSSPTALRPSGQARSGSGSTA